MKNQPHITLNRSISTCLSIVLISLFACSTLLIGETSKGSYGSANSSQKLKIESCDLTIQFSSSDCENLLIEYFPNYEPERFGVGIFSLQADCENVYSFFSSVWDSNGAYLTIPFSSTGINDFIFFTEGTTNDGTVCFENIEHTYTIKPEGVIIPIYLQPFTAPNPTGMNVVFDPPIIMDCPQVSGYESTHLSGDFFPIGCHEVINTISFNDGSSIDYSQFIEVVFVSNCTSDAEPPVCNNNELSFQTNNSNSIYNLDLSEYFIDNCDDDLLIFGSNVTTQEDIGSIVDLPCGLTYSLNVTAQDDDLNTITCLFSVTVECAANPENVYATYSEYIGDTLQNHINRVKHFQGNNYILGYNEVDDQKYPNFTKLDSFGNIEWSTRFVNEYQLFDFELLENGRFILVGRTEPVILNNTWQDNESVIIHINPTGSVFKEILYQNPGREGLFNIVKHKNPVDSDFPFYVTGFHNKDTQPTSLDRVILMNLDINGNINWTTKYSNGNDDEFARFLEPLSNGNLLIGGNVQVSGTNFKSQLLRISGNDGSIIKSIKTSRQEVYRNCAELDVSRLIVSSSTTNRLYLSILNNNLEPLSSYELQFSQLKEIRGIEVMENGTIVITGLRPGDLPALAYLTINNQNELIVSSGVQFSTLFLEIDNPLIDIIDETIIFADSRINENYIDRKHDIVINQFDYESIPMCYESFSLSFLPVIFTVEEDPNSFSNYSFPEGQNNIDVRPNLFTSLTYCSPMSCYVTISHSTQCNILNLNSSQIDFEDESAVTYSWTSSNTSFTSSVPDTTWVYQGDLSEIYICLEATEGTCTAIACDTIQVGQPELPIFEGCPDFISIPYSSECSGIIDFDNIIAFDPCTSEDIVSTCERSDGQQMTDPFPLGITTILCTANSISGLSNTCSFEVEVYDDVPPICILSTANFYLNESGVDTILLSTITPPGFDECSEVSFSDPGTELTVDCFPSAGISVDIQDIYGNNNSCLITYNVLDTITPVCMIGDQFIPAIAGQDSVQVFYEYDVNDNCSSPTVSFSMLDGSMFPCGSEQEITMYVEDNFGNTDTCTFSLTIEDCFNYIGSICGNVSEDLNCDGQLSVDEFPLEGIQIALLSPADNDTLLLVQTDSSGNFKVDSLPPFTFKVKPVGIDGLYEIGFPSADEYLVTIDTFQTIENLDFLLFYDGPTTALTLEEVCYIPGDTVILNWTNNPCLTSANLILFQSVCDNEMFSQIQNGIPNTGEYQYVIPIDASNQIIELAILGPGNTDFERFNCIEVNSLELDFSIELIGCKEYRFSASDDAYSSFFWSYGNGSSEFGEAQTTHTYAFNESFEVCLTIETALGCERTVCRNLTITGDCEDCSVTYTDEYNGCYNVRFTSLIDNYESTVQYTWLVDDLEVSTQANPFLDLGGPGTFEVCVMAGDVVCNDLFCRSITLAPIYPELLNCPEAIVTLSVGDECSPVNYMSGLTLGEICHIGDGSLPNIAYNRNDGQGVFTPYNIGTTMVTATITDLYGVTSDCVFTVEVVDDTPPVCQSVEQINVSLDENGEVTIQPFMLDNGSYDNCAEVQLSIEIASFNCSNLGSQEVALTASDGINQSTCLTTVTIEDKTPPQCTIDPITMTLDESGEVQFVLSDLNYTATDNCEVVDIELSHTLFTCEDTGEQTITLTVSDSSNNTSACSTTVTVIDPAPAICLSQDITVFLDESGMVQINPQMLDNGSFATCSAVDLSIENGSFDCTNIGAQEVVLLATSGTNTSSCSSTVVIVDDILPTCNIPDQTFIIQNNQTVVLDTDDYMEYVSDNCGVTMLEFSDSSFDCQDTGVHTIEATVSDGGNVMTCTFDIILIDNTVPVCQVIKSISLSLDENGQASLDPGMIDNGSFDNCGEPTLSLSQVLFDCSHLGPNEITFTAFDGTNSSTCDILVLIYDIFEPQCSLDDITVYADVDGNLALDLEDLVYTASDNCPDYIIEVIGNDLDCGFPGDHPISIIVTDSKGMTSECTATVTILDDIPPVCTSLEVEFEVTQFGQIAFPFVDINLFFDNCRIIGSEYTPPSTTCESIGSTILDVKINDSGGNQSLCPVTFTYLDRVAPQCFIDDMVVQATDDLGAIVTFTGTATDHCNDDIDITYSMPNGVAYACGEYSITMAATDEHGNSNSCDFSLVVRDCDACCLSEGMFLGLTEEDFTLDSEPGLGNCKFLFTAPTLSPCQLVTGIDWGDGTLSEFTISQQNSIEHIYTSPGLYNICVTYGEFNGSETCFQNTVCGYFEIFSDCTFQRLTSQILHEESLYPELSLYPNPTSSKFSIEVNNSEKTIQNIFIYNSSGWKVYESLNMLNSSIETLNLESINQGLYLIEVQLSDGNSITSKLLKI